jgi:membrane-associated protease RseP (regulator of RpoE activity)
MGHYIDIRLRGLPADMPVFIPGLAAYVRWRALGVPLATRAYVSLAGPLAGLIGAYACFALWIQTGDPLYSRLANWGVGLTVLNLIPVWVLDGGQAVRALSRNAQRLLLAISLLLCFVRGGSIVLAVVAGAVYQLFFNKEPARDGAQAVPANPEVEAPSTAAAVYFFSLLVASSLLLRLLR